MKNVSLRGLCLISVLALLSIAQGIQALSREEAKEIKEAQKDLVAAQKALKKCVRDRCHLADAKARAMCGATLCRGRQTEVGRLKRKIEGLEKKQN